MIVFFSSGRHPPLLTPSAHLSLRWPSALPLPLSPASVLPDAFLQRVARPAWRRAASAFQTSNLRVVMPSLLQRDGMAAMARMVPHRHAPRQLCFSLSHAQHRHTRTSQPKNHVTLATAIPVAAPCAPCPPCRARQRGCRARSPAQTATPHAPGSPCQTPRAFRPSCAHPPGLCLPWHQRVLWRCCAPHAPGGR